MLFISFNDYLKCPNYVGKYVCCRVSWPHLLSITKHKALFPLKF